MTLTELKKTVFQYSNKELYDYLEEKETEINFLRGAVDGDLALSLTPETLGSSAATVAADISSDEKFVRSVTVQLVDSNGTVNTIISGDFNVSVAVNTVGNGTAAIVDSATKVTLTNGIGGIDIEYTGAWAADDTCTLTVTGGTLLGYSLANKTSVDTLIA